METGTCIKVLDQLAELKAELKTIVFPMYFDEPTIHPSFKEIMKHQLRLGLIYDDWWFSTNGYGLARMSDNDWSELADAGFDYIRLTFHGIGQIHDELVDREGAYNDLIETIRKSEQHKVNWLAGMMLNSENQSMYEETKKTITELGTPCSDFGWMVPHLQGRAYQGNNHVKASQISRLLKGREMYWYEEREFVRKVISDPNLRGRTARDNRCGIVFLDVDENLNVFFGGGCDGDPFCFVKDRVLLGNLEETTISSCYHKYLNEPPEPVQLLNQITWGELAEKFGSTTNEGVFFHSSLPGRKWPAEYLREYYGE
jgi:MoaA/NifB/PqqE/SkfB family radical SAM enzyme